MQKTRTKAEAAADSSQQKLVNVGENLYRSASSKVYYAIIYVGKRQIKRSSKTTDRQTAEQSLDELRGKVGNLKPGESSTIDFLTLGYRWLAEHQHNLSRRTIRGKTDTIKVLSGSG